MTAQQTATPIKVGIAGWSYPDWDGFVYPARTRDKLRYAAQYVDVIEINSTFYRPPTARNAASWAERTADLPDFRFTAKLERIFTHQADVPGAQAESRFRDGLAPLVEAGRLAAVLIQFASVLISVALSCDLSGGISPDSTSSSMRLA